MKYKSVFCTPHIASSLLPVASSLQSRSVTATQIPLVQSPAPKCRRPFLFQLFAFQLPEKTEKKKVEINIENEN
jgi:hypothetical protein